MKVKEARFAVKFKLKPGGVDQVATIIVDATSKGEAKILSQLSCVEIENNLKT